jgi:tetratricopeptide (TPR) repeat protein
MQTTVMEAQFRGAERVLRQGQKQRAGLGYREVLKLWKQRCKSYYPRISGAYLIAGNAFQQLGQPRTALRCYETGLLNEPNSIALLTTLGGCAFRLGEYEKAFAALQKSNSIYPLKRSFRPIWKKLKDKNRGDQE